VAAARELKQFVNGSPASLLEVARAEIHVGNLAEAARNLQQFARMGQSTDLLETSTEFAPLRNLAGFSEIQRTMKANHTSIGLASTAFLLSDSHLLAEDLDYDPQAKQFLVTSVRERKIISIVNGVLHDFAKAPDDWPMLAIKVDSRRGLVWATEVAMQGFVFAAASDWGRSAVLCYDLRNGKLRRRVEGPAESALGDMTLTEGGDVIVSDGEGGGVYRVLLKKDALERLDNGDFISPQTPAMHPDGKHVFVPDYVRGIGMLDLATKQVQWLSTENRFALNGIDGLYFDRGRLIAVQNGTSPERVSRSR
jgi:sugar lactone lactonase YvrE